MITYFYLNENYDPDSEYFFGGKDKIRLYEKVDELEGEEGTIFEITPPMPRYIQWVKDIPYIDTSKLQEKDIKLYVEEDNYLERNTRLNNLSNCEHKKDVHNSNQLDTDLKCEQQKHVHKRIHTNKKDNFYSLRVRCQKIDVEIINKLKIRFNLSISDIIRETIKALDNSNLDQIPNKF